MKAEFYAVPRPSRELMDRLSETCPDNPFCTYAYSEVRRRLGAEPFAIYVGDDSAISSSCLGFLTRGSLNARLEITSLPVIVEPEKFWDGLFEFCKDEGVAALSILTFGSTASEIPEDKHIVSRKKRCEFRHDLTVPDLWEVTNRRHHRLIKKARANDMTISVCNDESSRQIHVDLANASLDRRRDKGDSVNSEITRDDVDAFLDLNAGDIYQAKIGDEVCATLLVAKSTAGGYAQSSGSSLEGRKIGASHFLFYEVACSLKAEGKTVFNLGGADEESTGLQEFKLGLGAEKLELEAAEFFIGSVLKKFAGSIAGVLRRHAR